MAPVNQILPEIEKLICKNVIRYFSNQPDKLKTLPHVETFAQKQLDFFIQGLMQQSPNLMKLWKKGHPFIAKAAINHKTLDFEIKIIET